ncbi:putative zinc protease pqqL [Pantoea sp. AS-PWVM4]|uniref:M16 family metallopeptidase n=1 Tax=Pantoea sp. AS-PWVM4 TaxID=1332069 RepID=UPI0003AC7BC9|nr:insulinase family protein [Pantoea sp. AS-PWVM4]ERK16425.1 putative zinc protease pqqL [Pantoea sp. AS-PWVM4]
MCKRRGLAGVALFLLVLSQPVLSEDAKTTLPVVTEGVLDNGLQYTLAPIKSDAGRIDIRLSVEAGSLDETDEQSGVAHMVEHLVFRGSDAWPEGVSAALAKKGWSRGANYNAVTNYERTQFMMSPPDGVKGLDLALQALAQMTAHARITQPDLDDERKVILEEWRGKLGVAARMNQQRIAALRADSPYPDRPTIGNVESIEHTPAATLKAFYQRWYHPDNMRLLIIGDFEPEKVKALITKHFAGLPAIAVPVRQESQYNQQLKKQFRVIHLQDSESGGSQVSWVNRFDEKQMQGTEGYRDRLINQITLTVLSRQLKRQQSALPDSIGNIVARKSETGRSTVAFGLFVDVMPGDFQLGLATLIRERERLMRYGLSVDDFARVKSDILDAAKRLEEKPENRTFSEWVQTLAIAWQQNQPYADAQQRGVRAVAELKTIDMADINTRLNTWLQATDQLVQFSVPGRYVYSVPLPSEIQRMVTTIAGEPLTPVAKEKTSVSVPLPEHDTSGKRTSVKNFPTESVQEWRLSNGDRVVWMKTPLAKDRIWFQAQSEAGYLGRGLNAWQAQLAAQLAGFGAPTGWTDDGYVQWKRDQELWLNISQQPDTLEVTGSAPYKRLDSLLHAYQLLHTDNHMNAASLKSSVMMLARRRLMQEGSLFALRQMEVTELRYGGPALELPDATQLSALNSEQLTTQWKKISAAPVTYFVMANLPEATLRQAVERYLAGIKRGAGLPAEPYLALPGHRERRSQLNKEPKAEVRLWSFSNEVWSPERAAQVSIAKNLVNRHLKNVLRDDARGIYSLSLETVLNDKTNRIETELRFSTSPERAAELVQIAKKAFKNADSQINDRTVQEMKASFQRAETSRQHDYYTLQRRLILSYRHYDNPGYLSRVSSLDKAITTDGVRAVASRIYNPDNLVIYTVLPQETK